MEVEESVNMKGVPKFPEERHHSVQATVVDLGVRLKIVPKQPLVSKHTAGLMHQGWELPINSPLLHCQIKFLTRLFLSLVMGRWYFLLSLLTSANFSDPISKIPQRKMSKQHLTTFNVGDKNTTVKLEAWNSSTYSVIMRTVVICDHKFVILIFCH